MTQQTDAGGDQRPPEVRVELPLLGRDAEVDQIRALLGHARNGRGASLLLAGEPGIGKTTLMNAVVVPVRWPGVWRPSTLTSIAPARDGVEQGKR